MNEDKTILLYYELEDSLQSRTSKNLRVRKVLDILDSDEGLEDALFKVLSKRKDKSKELDVNLPLCCLNAMSKLNLSQKKWDDFRFWLIDMINRGVDLSNLPSRMALSKEVLKLVPPGVVSSETEAYVPLEDSLHHTGQCFLERYVFLT